MLKKTLLILLGLYSSAAMAQFTPSPAERQALYQAVEKTVYTGAMLRGNILMLGQGYAYQNLDDDNMKNIKIYNIALPQVQQCLAKQFQAKTYATALKQGMDFYFKNVDKAQFEHDLAWFRQPERAKSFDLNREIVQFIAQHADELGKYTAFDTQPFPPHIETKWKALQAKQEGAYNVLHKDGDKLLNGGLDGGEWQHVAEFLGVSEAHNPFETNRVGQVNPMVAYHQKTLDICHQGVWRDIRSGKMPF